MCDLVKKGSLRFLKDSLLTEILNKIYDRGLFWALYIASILNIHFLIILYRQYPVKFAYPLQLAQGQWTQLWERVFQPQSQRRRCWRSRHPLQSSCHLASGHLAEYHAPDSTTPSMHCQSGHLLVLRGLRYTHAKMEKQYKNINNGLVRGRLFIRLFSNNYRWTIFH